MGLSERKTKQKLGADPRNLAWANDNSRFGQQYLEKFGWSAGSGSGLGASGEGRLAHISVAQKLNLLGIGGNTGNNGDVSWKQNREYEMMLKRLNTSGGDGDSHEVESIKASMVPDGFVRAVEGTVADQKVATNVSVEEVDEKERKRLRKERKRREKAAAKANASIDNDGISLDVAPSSAMVDPASTVSPSQPVPSTKPPRRLAHRAKFRASKQLASSNATALIEILGISRSAIPSEAPSQIQSTLDTPADSPSPAPECHHAADDQIRTSTTSVADYFAAKMRARQQVAVTVTPTVFQSNESVPVPEPEPEPEAEVQDSPEGTTPVDGIVARKKEKKRKRKDAVDEKAETYDDDRMESHAESKKRKKKKRKAE